MARLEHRTIEAIYKSSLKFLESLDYDQTLATIVEEAVKLVKGDYGSILLSQNARLERAYASNALAFQTQIRKKGNTYKCFTTGRAILSTIKEMQEAHPELKKAGISSTIFIPLKNKKQSIGVLTVNSKKSQDFSDYELHILQLFGSMASLAIRKTQSFEETRKALDTRDMFISMASHELRTPITTINGYAQLLQTKIKEEGITKKWVDELGKEVFRLTELVKELLEINRIKTGNLQYFYKEARITDTLDRAVKTIEFGYPDRKLVIENNLGDDDIIVGDFDKLLQALTNILENAAKYSSQGATIRVSLGRRNNQIRISVKDEGIGINSKELPHLFEGYVRGKNHTREGLGLGLFLTKSIIDKHKGSIRIKSKENRGTTVEVLLPRVKEAYD